MIKYIVTIGEHYRFVFYNSLDALGFANKAVEASELGERFKATIEIFKDGGEE